VPCSVAPGADAIVAGGPRVGALPGRCAGNELRRLACPAAVSPAHRFRCSKYARHRTRCKYTPRARSAGSQIPGTSSPAPQCHPLQGLDNAVRRVHKRLVELPLARTAPKARGLTAKSCPGPSPLRRQLLRITKMRGIAMPDRNRQLRRRRATALPLPQIHSAVTRIHTRLLKGTIFGKQDRTNFR
jgi:hypothetical protein